MTLHRFLQKIITSVKNIAGIEPPEIKPVETTAIGISDINPGDTTNTDGMGDTLSGLPYVDEVSHAFGSNGYRQSFDLERNATGQDGENADDSDRKDTD